MKKSYLVVIILFFLLLALPLIAFNWEEDVVSEIDNRRLTPSPFKAESFSEGLRQTSAYVNDRIGFRNGMIRLYTKAHDRLFGEMVHPAYQYGQNGYVFFKGNGSRNALTEFDYAFLDTVEEIYRYCQEREVPFLFLFDPSKQSIYYEQLHPGIRYQNGWVEQFMALLEERGIPYTDNTGVMRELASQGVAVFNRQYDAGHWNDLGAFYGTNAALAELKKQLPSVHVNQLSEFTQTAWTATSLPVSEFAIREEIPLLTAIEPYTDRSAPFAELAMDPSFPTHIHCAHPTRQAEGAPRALVFQGSYYNSYGWKFLANSFSEYDAVHDYQNVLNFSYYYHIFQPDCVIFEVAEYTFDPMYFDYEAMLDFDLPPLPEQVTPIEAQVSLNRGEYLTTVTVVPAEETEYLYLRAGDTLYDLAKGPNGTRTLCLRNENLPDQFDIVA